MRDYGAVYRNEYLANTNPVLSVLAVTIGWLMIVPPFVSWWRTTARIRRAQEIAQEPLLSGWLIVAFYLGAFFISFAGLGIPAVVQTALNGIWKKYSRSDAEALAMNQLDAVAPVAPPATAGDAAPPAPETRQR